VAGATGWSELLRALYPGHPDLAAQVERLLAAHTGRTATGPPWSQADAWLITYADQFQTAGQAPLVSLNRFYRDHLAPWINGIHILPFYPWSSDDGYSIIDYSAVDPRYGTWHDVETLASNTRAMFDAVINHVSAGSRWFLGYLEGDPEYDDFFIALPPETDLSAVVRPRTSPLLTAYESHQGTIWVWTTFSADQVDLNYRSGRVLLAVLGVLLDYARRGASMIRLDAVQFLWKEVGASCINMPQGHQVIQLLRAIMDEVYPGVVFVTETNVPHRENISYFGGQQREAQMVYQFALPPLVLDALHTGSVDTLKSWINDLDPLPTGCTYLNFLSSHDGVGVRPVESILSEARINDLLELNERGGGLIGARSVGRHTKPYELNTSWFSLMETGYDPSQAVLRHLASHAIMMALRGIPAIYALSMVGASNDQAEYHRTGRPRSLNRTRFATENLESQLADRNSITSQVLSGIERMLRIRSSSPAFHPDSPQRVLVTPPGVLGIERGASDYCARVYVNVVQTEVAVADPGPDWQRHGLERGPTTGPLELGPWSSIWLTKGE
jgi:sucrose phosphorylase